MDEQNEEKNLVEMAQESGQGNYDYFGTQADQAVNETLENQRDMSRPRMKLAEKIILVVLAMVACLVIAIYFISNRSEPEIPEPDPSYTADDLQDITDYIDSYHTHPEEVQQYYKYLKVVNGDSEAIGLYSIDYSDGEFYYSIFNGNEYFYNAEIALSSDDEVEQGSNYPFMMLPFEERMYSLTECAKQPSSWAAYDEIFVDFSYNKPSYAYEAYNTTDDDGAYYYIYATGTKNVTYDNFVALAKRQYAMNLLLEFDDEAVYMIDSDLHSTVDYGTYSEYSLADTAYKADLDLTNGEIRIYEMQNGSFVEKESVRMR